MIEKIIFSYKRVTKGDVNDHVFDNYGNEYIHFKTDNGIMQFKKVEDNNYYFFDKNGVMLNRKDISLHIEHEKNIKEYKYLVRNLSCKENKIFYLKISDNCYFEFRTDDLYADYKLVKCHEYYFENCHEPDYDEKRVMFNHLYELGYGYNPTKQELFPKVDFIQEGKYYIYENTIFKAYQDKPCDYRREISIPYVFLIDLDSKKQSLLYENATLGLPSYICIREATEQEIGQANEIYESLKVNFLNVERKLINIKADLAETLQMLYELKNENGQQG